ncbi:MAG: YhbY family RNA-binding protein [Methanomethylophilus sp.]|jgi:RNA-binding protein
MSEREAKKELLRRAAGIDATVRIGKDGVTEGIGAEVTAQLKKRRLIKAKVLNNCEEDPDDVAKKLEEMSGGVAVDVRGGVIVMTDKRTWTSLCQKKND